MSEPRNPGALAVLAADALSGRRALVTGGGTGIGRATAHQLARLGADVWIVGRRSEVLEEAAEGHELIRSHPCDVREPDQVQELMSIVRERSGGLDLLVNNAGGQFVSRAQDVSLNGFRAVTKLNLEATWNVTTSVAREFMIPQGYGKVVSITMTPRRGMPGMSHSSAARAAVESLTRTLAVEWGPLGVRLAAVAPGVVHTQAWERYGISGEDLARVIPLGALQTVDDVAALVSFLLSTAGDYITGVTIAADGGFGLAGPGSA